MQSTLSAAGDSVGAKAAKFIAGSMIPVVGSSVGDSLKTVAGSIKYIRTGVGIGGIVIIILILLPTLISIITTRLSFMAAGTAAKLLGCNTESDLLGELTNIYGYLLAVVASCSVLFIFALTIMARTSAAIA
jgi:stage III sporulation protein AE